jgi:hypothetical protein
VIKSIAGQHLLVGWLYSSLRLSGEREIINLLRKKCPSDNDCDVAHILLPYDMIDIISVRLPRRREPMR